METCKYGSGADKRKPTAVKRKGVVYRAYRKFQNSPGTDLNVVLLSLLKSDAKVYQKVINRLYQKCCF